MQKKQKKRIQQATEQVAKQLESKTPVYDLAKLERLERERDKALEHLSKETKDILDKFETNCNRTRRAINKMVIELAEDLRRQFLNEKKPLLVTCISTIICRAVAGKEIISDRTVQRLLGEEYKDPLQRMRALHGRQESADEHDPMDIREAAENPKNAAEYKTEEIAEVKNPITLKQIAQVKSQRVDFMSLQIEELTKDRDHWKQQAEFWEAKFNQFKNKGLKSKGLIE